MGVQTKKRAVHLSVAALDTELRAKRGRPISRATTSNSRRAVGSWRQAWQRTEGESTRAASLGRSGAPRRTHAESLPGGDHATYVSGVPRIGDRLQNGFYAGRRAGLPDDDRTAAGERSARELPHHGRVELEQASQDEQRSRPPGQGDPLRTQRASTARALFRSWFSAGHSLHRGCRADPGHRDPGRGRERSLHDVGGLRGAALAAAADHHADRGRHGDAQSAGHRDRRAVLAPAFACEPELILSDEPASALDTTTAANILDLFGEFQRKIGQTHEGRRFNLSPWEGGATEATDEGGGGST